MKRLQKQQVSHSSGCEAASRSAVMQFRREREERGWASNQMRGNLLFLRKHTLSFPPAPLPPLPLRLLCLQSSSKISLYDNVKLTKTCAHKRWSEWRRITPDGRVQIVDLLQVHIGFLTIFSRHNNF